MDHTTLDTDTDALLAEVDALLAASDAMDARIEALLRTGSVELRMADLALQMEIGRGELDQIEREQAAIAAVIDAMESG